MDFHVDQIDHVELTVPDRHAAAKWYRDVLGLVIVAEYEHWAMDPKGPLMITTPQGSTKCNRSRPGIGLYKNLII